MSCKKKQPTTALLCTSSLCHICKFLPTWQGGNLIRSLWNGENRYVSTHDINVKWSGQKTPLFLMSDVLPVNAMVTTEDETGEINTGIQLWQEAVGGGSDTVFLLMSRHCICWKHLLCAVKKQPLLCCIQKHWFSKARLHSVAASFCQTWTHKRASAQRFLQLS